LLKAYFSLQILTSPLETAAVNAVAETVMKI